MHIILADSNDLMRIGIRTILNESAGFKIVGEARSNDELLELVKHFDASVVVVDYSSVGFDIDIVPKVLNLKKDLRVLAITPDQSAAVLVNALRSGVISYVKKDCAVRETSKGNKFFCGQILETIQRANIDVNDLDVDGFSCEPVLLSEREMEIIKYIAEGYTNTQIAEILFLSNHTVNTHRKNIMAKLGVKNTAGIVMYAVKTDLVSPNKFLFAGEA
jgi:DNA-binding NarL/FixJ family response regulator